MASPPESPTMVACPCQRRSSFKRMVQDVAEDLGAKDVQRIAYIHDLPDDYKTAPALEALQHLERKGRFSDSSLHFLESLLTDISRCDLVCKHLEPFRQSYCHPAGASPPMPTSLTPPSLSLRKKLALHAMSPVSGQGDFEISIRLKPDEKSVVCDLLHQYVPKEEIRKHQSISEKLFNTSFLRHTWKKPQKMKSMGDHDDDTFKDGPKVAATSVSAPNSPLAGYNARRATVSPQDLKGHDSDSEMSPLGCQTRRATYLQQKEIEEGEGDMDWVVLYHEEGSQSDSGMCTSMDSSLDIEICKDHLSQEKLELNSKACNSNSLQDRQVTWRIKRSDFMVPIFQHQKKVFKKKIKLCLKPSDMSIPLIFRIYPNGFGCNENIYTAFRVEQICASHLMPKGTNLRFHISVRDMQSSDILLAQYMEVPVEEGSHNLEQFLAHEVIKSSEARHFEIKITISSLKKS